MYTFPLELWVEMRTVLVVDDDPSHLKLYSLVIERGGFDAITALVQRETLALPEDARVDLAVLDYRLGTQITAVDVARRLQASFPGVPIVVLSDVMWMPEDIAPYAVGFVRKGEPEQLLATIASTLSGSSK